MRNFSLGSVLLFVAATVSAGLFDTPAHVDHYQFRRQVAVSRDGNCGLIKGVSTTCLGSEQGDCCSYLGFCGGNSSYCGNGCQSNYGTCGDENISTDGSCGGSKGLTCIGFAEGSCCSEKGFCGSTDVHCGTGCQQEFGECGDDTAEPKTTATTGDSESEATSPAGSAGTAQTQNNSDNGDGDNQALKIGLGAGIPAGLIAIGGLVALIYLRRRRQAVAVEDAGEKSIGTPVSHELSAVDKPVELVASQQEAVELPAVSYRN